MITKFLNLIKTYQHDLFLALCMILVAGIGYNLGHVSAVHKSGITLDGDSATFEANAASVANSSGSTSKKPASQAAPRDPRVVVSKNSTSKVYHYTWCSGASRIKDANKVWFASASLAEAAGYTLAGNCN